MTIAVTLPWTEDRFLRWADSQEERYEFDGTRPEAMTGGTAYHSRITTNIHVALRGRLRGTKCSHFGPDLAVGTIGGALRFPDVLISCTPFPEAERIALDPVVVFEVLSPESGRRDRIVKMREYAAVPSIRRYVIVESRAAGLIVLHRSDGGDPWIATALTAEDILCLPEVNAEIPVSEIYEDVVFTD
jgi:Uma2 family endonuclease